MKKLMMILALVAGFQAHATSDAFTEVALVTYDYNRGDYLVRIYPTEGCYGLEYGPQAAVFGQPFVVTAGMGCGMPGQPINVNALSCGKVDIEWDADYTRVVGVKADISACPDDEMENHHERFSAAIKKAAQKNFGAGVKVEVL